MHGTAGSDILSIISALSRPQARRFVVLPAPKRTPGVDASAGRPSVRMDGWPAEASTPDAAPLRIHTRTPSRCRPRRAAGASRPVRAGGVPTATTTVLTVRRGHAVASGRVGGVVKRPTSSTHGPLGLAYRCRPIDADLPIMREGGAASRRPPHTRACATARMWHRTEVRRA